MLSKEDLKKEFYNYVSNYNMEDNMIYLKYLHSMKVADISEKIAVSLDLSDYEVYIAYLIGLLHDIGRFEQIKRFNTFSDIKSGIDHADFGVSILFDDNVITKFIDREDYYDIIKIAIRNHNKFNIEDNITEKELLFSKIIRDADKIDIYRIIVYDKELRELNKGNSIDNNDLIITDNVLNSFYNEELINNKSIVTYLDKYINAVSYIYDINFPISFKLIKENNYIDKFIDKIYNSFKLNKNILNEFEIIRKVANDYLNTNMR